MLLPVFRYKVLFSREFKRIYHRIFNWRFIVLVIITGVFACILKQIYLEILQLSLSLDKLDLSSLSFYTIVIFFRFVLSIILEESFSCDLQDGGNSFKSNNTLLMEDKSSGKANSSAASSESVKSSKNYDAMLNMSDNLKSTLKEMLESAHELNRIKIANNITYLVDKSGGLQMDVPSSLSDEDARIISDKVSDLDSKFIASSHRYDRLLVLDQKLYNGEMGDDFKVSHENAKNTYHKLFK